MNKSIHFLIFWKLIRNKFLINEIIKLSWILNLESWAQGYQWFPPFNPARFDMHVTLKLFDCTFCWYQITHNDHTDNTFGRPRREAGECWCLPPAWNLRAVSLIPLLYTSSLVLLPSPVALSGLSFSAFGPLSWHLFRSFCLLTCFSLNLLFPER